MVAIVKSLFRAEEPAEEPAAVPGGDDGIRIVTEATEGSSNIEVVLPPEWKAYLDKKEEKRVASARAEHRRESIEADTTPPSPLKGHQRASEDEGCAASSGGSSTGGSSCSNSQWFSGRGESLRSLVSGAGGWELPATPLTDPLTGEQRTGRCTFGTHELTKAGTYWLLLWAENHAGDPANPERAGANVDDLAPPTDKGARIVLLRTLIVSPGPFSLRHSQVRMPQQMEPPKAGQSFGLGILSFDKFGNPLRTGGNVKLSLKTAVCPPPSPLPTQPPPMTFQHIDHLDGFHEVRITTFRAGDHQLMLSAVPTAGSSTANAADATGRVLRLRVVAAELDPSKCVLKPLGADGLAVTTTSSVSADRLRGGKGDTRRPPIALRAGQWASALLQCSDCYGNLRPAIAAIASGLQLELTEGLGSEDSLGPPLPPSQLRTEQRLNADGSIWLRYAPLGCGPRSLSIKLQSAHVVGSPLRLEVAAGAMQLRACELVGEGRSFCHQHEKANFRVLAKDGFGNQLTRGGEKFVVLIRREGNEGPADVSASVRDDCDGSYAVEYMCETIGRHYVSVHHGSADGDELPGSPFVLRCLPGSAHLASCRFVAAHHGVRALMLERDLEALDDGKERLSLGTVGAYGVKLKVQVRLRDKQGVATRMSARAAPADARTPARAAPARRSRMSSDRHGDAADRP